MAPDIARSEIKVYPYAELEDLRLDLLPRLRIMAANNSGNQGIPGAACLMRN